MAVVAPDRAVDHAHPDCGEARRQLALGTLSPGHTPPGMGGQNRLGLTRLLVRHGLAGPPGRRHELHVEAVDLLVLRDTNRPGQPARIEAVAEGGTAAVA